MRSSGVKWPSQMPEDWSIVEIKYVAQLGNGSTPLRDNDDYWSGGSIPWLTSTVVNHGIVPPATEFVTERACKEYHLPIVRPGSVLIAITGQGRTRGIASVLPYEATINQHLAYITPSVDVLTPDFLQLFLTSAYDILRTISDDAGSTRGALTLEQLGNFPVLVPPLAIQCAITDFLNKETAQIDALIARKQRLLGLLAEKRQVLITQVVTKGLDPYVPMRGSGVEWLGEIPQHWSVISLKHLAEVRTGITKGRNIEEARAIKVPYIRVANVQDGYVDLSDVADIEILPDELPDLRLQKGDVLMNEGGDADKLGRGAIWDGSIDPCVHQNHVFAVRCLSIEPTWLALAIRTSHAKAYFESCAKRTTNLASISATNLREVPIPIPPDAERIQIETYLAFQLSRTDLLRSKVRAAIERLEERRLALISAIVTGKIDVTEQVCRSSG